MHDHDHSHAKNSSHHTLLSALIFTLAFAVVETLAGLHAHSLALLSDAGHMVSDSLALGVAAFAAWISKKPPSTKHSYGMGRAEVVGAWISSVLILLVAIGIITEAVNRMHSPHAVKGGIVMTIATLGLLVNLVVAWLLSRGEKTLNVRAAIMHVIGDVLGSVSALITGAVIYFTGWVLIDPILSIFISVLILFSGFKLLRESLLILMEAVPKHLDLDEIGKKMVKIRRVERVHDLHIWTLSSGMTVLTAHIDIDDLKHWPFIYEELHNLLKEKYHIEHVTLQPATKTQVIHHMPNVRF